jgi:hypothetical protein
VTAPALPWHRIARAVGLAIARWGLLVLLVAILLRAVAVPLIRGERPAPSSPPDGYVSPDASVRLSWSRGAAEGPLRLEVCRDRDFRAPEVSEEVRGTSLTLRPLERGRTWYWRLEPGGVVGMFRTSDHAVHF